MLVVIALLQIAGSWSPAKSEVDQDVVVNAKTAQEAKQRLEVCIAQHCTPDREIAAALVFATRQMVDGDYAAARQTLLEARRRNHGADAVYPAAVSNLHRALNRLSTLDGRQDAARIAAADATDALRSGLEADDPAILRQRLFSGMQLAREGRISGATEIFNDVAAQARRRGLAAVEAEALFNGAVLYATLAGVNPLYQTSAKRWIKRIADRPEPAFVKMREPLALMKLSLEALAAKPEERAAIYARAKPIAVDEAVLLEEPDLQLLDADPQLASRNGANGGPEWADVGFWVRPNGRVHDIAVVRQSDSRLGTWLTYKLKAVGQRRYAPFHRPTGDRGLYRVERYSMVHNFLPTTTATHIPVRAGTGNIDTMDMTPLYRPPA